MGRVKKLKKKTKKGLFLGAWFKLLSIQHLER